MSTPMTLMLRVKDEHIGQITIFDEAGLPKGFRTSVDPSLLSSPSGRWLKKKNIRPITIKGQYIKIYVHWNGYPEDNTDILSCFDSYDKVLNLLLLGNCSSLCSKDAQYPPRFRKVKVLSSDKLIVPYLMQPDRPYDEKVLPVFAKSDRPIPGTEYSYKFEGNQWWARKNGKGCRWMPLVTYL